MTYYEAKASCVDYQTTRSTLKGRGGPFWGWVVSGQRWESFNLNGNVQESEI